VAYQFVVIGNTISSLAEKSIFTSLSNFFLANLRGLLCKKEEKENVSLVSPEDGNILGPFNGHLCQTCHALDASAVTGKPHLQASLMMIMSMG
jgi:hypothetical protein